MGIMRTTKTATDMPGPRECDAQAKGVAGGPGAEAHAQRGVEPPKQGMDALDKLQLGVDVVGIVPVCGNVANGVNGVVSVGRAIDSAFKGKGRTKEHLLNAGISAVGLIPVAGNLAAGAKVVKAGKAMKCVSRGTRVVTLSKAGTAAVTASRATRYAMAADAIRKGAQVGKGVSIGMRAPQALSSAPKPKPTLMERGIATADKVQTFQTKFNDLRARRTPGNESENSQRLQDMTISRLPGVKPIFSSIKHQGKEVGPGEAMAKPSATAPNRASITFPSAAEDAEES